jgi:hypothetical protein
MCMKLWERALEIERLGEGYNLINPKKETIILGRCPGMYGMPDYKDDKVDNCQDFTFYNDYTPCTECWEREYDG